MQLFERRSRGVVLTADGARVQAQFTRAFDALGEAAATLRQSAKAPPITIATLPAIAQLWLPARLGPLRAALGHRQISVTALEEPPNLLRESYDLSLFVRPPGTGAIIVDDVTFPVCAPSLAEHIRTPDDLTGQTLLHDASWQRDWAEWAKRVGLALAGAKDGPRYSLYSLVLAEARAGVGVALGHGFLVEDDLASGRLMRPFEAATATGLALVLDVGPRFTGPEAEAIVLALRGA